MMLFMCMSTIVYTGCDIPDKNAAALRVFYNALALKEYGYHVEIISFDHDFIAQTVYKDEQAGMTVWHLPYPKTSIAWIRYLIELDAYIRIIEANTDVRAIIVYDQPVISFLRLKRYCAKRRIKLVCDCAEWHSTAHLHGIKKIIKGAGIALSMRYAYKKSDGLIAISSYLQRYYCKYTPTIKVVPLQKKPINVSEIAKVNTPRAFIYAGTIGADKDKLNLIIEAFSKVKKPFLFHIFGITQDEFIDAYPQDKKAIDLINSLPDSRIVFHGYTNHHTVVSFLKSADFSFLIRENNRKNNAGFPTKFGESVMCGTPVLSTDFSDVKSYIDELGIGILLDENSQIETFIEHLIVMDKSELLNLKRMCVHCDTFDYHSYIAPLGNFVEKLCIK